MTAELARMLYLLHNARNNIVDTGGCLMNEQQVGELNSALGDPGIWCCAMPAIVGVSIAAENRFGKIKCAISSTLLQQRPAQLSKMR